MLDYETKVEWSEKLKFGIFMNKIATLPTTQWRIAEDNTFVADRLMRELGISPIISKILTSRDISNADDAKRYLKPSLQDIHNPFLMKDMKAGVQRLIRALYNREKIVVYGDYDADGITSVVVLLKFLREISPDISYYIPDRIAEGYGLHQEAIDKIKAGGATLIITVDCGISDHEQIAYASSLGIDVVILDHHEVSATLPGAVAVINPHRGDCKFPFKHLAAVGIAFNFLIALRGSLRQDGYWSGKRYPNLKEYLDLVALGTIGDISPLTLDNRIFVKTGLELITHSQRPGIVALKEICGIEGQTVDTVKASFSLLPRINAAGRIDSPMEAVNLLLCDDIQEARTIARRLDEYNRRRQLMEKNILREIAGEIEEVADYDAKKAFVFASENWHPGVIGIVASRLVEQYCRPVILISIKEGIGKGSGRSCGAFNIYQYLKKCEPLLLSFGGHRYAAGISIKQENIAEFNKQLDAALSEKADASVFLSQTFIDVQCSLNDIDHELLAQIEMLAPFGTENPEPVMCVRNVCVSSPSVVGNNHLRIRVSGDGVSCNSIWFSKGQFVHLLPGTSLDIAFTPQISHWRGVADIQLKMRDIAISA